MSHCKDYDRNDPNNHPEPPRPSRVMATLFDYDLNKWTLQPVSPIFETAKKAKQEARKIARDLPDARYVYCQN